MARTTRTKRADGRLQKKITVKANGITKRVLICGHTEKELTDKEFEKRKEAEQGITALTDPTISQYYEQWAKARDGVVSEATLRTQDKYFGVISKVKIPEYSKPFGKIKLRDICRRDGVGKAVLISLQSGLRDGRSTQTVNDYMNLVKHIFSDALKDGLVDFNPCLAMRNLKRTEEKARDTTHRALSIEETKAFFECERCKSSYYYNVFVFAINTGMRIGEIGALRYSDIRKETIHVERTVTRTETGAYVVGDTTKTESGRRSIPMTKAAAAAVNNQRKLAQLTKGCIPTAAAFIFPSPEDCLLLSTPINREIKRICKQCGVVPFSMHALRATFATRAIESGMNPKTLQEILGHSNFNITMSLYGHCLDDTKRNEMDLLQIAN